MSTSPLPIIRIDRDRFGRWHVALSADRECASDPAATCETLEEARNVAYRQAAEYLPCELVVHDAYHRVIIDEQLSASHDRGRLRRNPARR